MSTYWWFKCNTCNTSCDERGNHFDKVLLDILKMVKYFKQIRALDTQDYIEFHILGHGSSSINFAIEHCDHDMVIHSEYGDWITKDGITMLKTKMVESLGP